MNAFAPTAAASAAATALTSSATLALAMFDPADRSYAARDAERAAARWELTAYHLASGATVSVKFIAEQLAYADELMAGAGPLGLPAQADKILAILNG